MAKRSTRLRARLAMPLSLLILVIVEEIVTFEVRRRLHNPYLETLAIVACYGVGFAIVGNVLGPRLERTIRDGERSTHRGSGVVGTLFFFAVAYGLIYLLFFLIETRGVQVLLPPAWR